MIKYCVGHFMIEIKINVEDVVRIDHISLTKLVSPCVKALAVRIVNVKPIQN